MASADKNSEAAELRKLASVLRELVDASENERLEKAAHVLCASKGLALIQQKVRGWYEPLP